MFVAMTSYGRTDMKAMRSAQSAGPTFRAGSWNPATGRRRRSLDVRIFAPWRLCVNHPFRAETDVELVQCARSAGSRLQNEPQLERRNPKPGTAKTARSRANPTESDLSHFLRS